MTIQLQNEYLKAEFSTYGGELIRLQDAAGRDYLWSGDPAHWKYHSPVLFPFVGKQMGGAFRCHGRSFPIGQHGFARTSEFTLKEQTGDSVSFSVCSDEQTLSLYPFDFELVNSYRLQGSSLIVSWKVTNPSSNANLYFQVGAHPAFLVPANGEGKREDCSICLKAGKKYSYIRIDLQAEAADPDHQYELDTDEAGKLRIRPGLFDIDTYIFENGQIDEAALCGPDGKPYLAVKCPGFPYFGIWSPSDKAPFVCLEPWYGRLDNRGFTGDISEKTGIQSLHPGESFHASYEIEIL